MQSQIKVIERNLLDMNSINEFNDENNTRERRLRAETRKELGLLIDKNVSQPVAGANEFQSQYNQKTARACSEVAGNTWASSHLLKQTIEHLMGIQKVLYYDMTTMRPVLRARYHLDAEYSIPSGDITDMGMNSLKMFLEKNGLKVGTDALESAMVTASAGGNEERATNDFKNMIELVRKEYTPNPKIFDELESRLGTEHSTYSSTLIMYLLATVYYKQLAPDLNGFQAPAANFILYGAQGSGKSVFFTRLANGDNHQYRFSKRPNFGDKDVQTAMAQAWLINDDDLVASSRESDVAELKSEITNTSFTVRLPYGRHTVTLIKRGTHVGSTNKAGFLFDDTGDRRTWILETQVGKSKAEAKEAGTEFGDWFTKEKALTLWATFDGLVRDLENPLELVKPLLEAPQVEGRRAELVHDHQKLDPLTVAIDSALAQLNSTEPQPDPLSGTLPLSDDGTALVRVAGELVGWSGGAVSASGFNRLVRDELAAMDERTKGRTREIAEQMRQRGYGENHMNGARKYKKL